MKQLNQLMLISLAIVITAVVGMTGCATTEMNASGKDYFEEWQKEGDKYKNPRIQQLSEQRRLELSRILLKNPEIHKNI